MQACVRAHARGRVSGCSAHPLHLHQHLYCPCQLPTVAFVLGLPGGEVLIKGDPVFRDYHKDEVRRSAPVTFQQKGSSEVALSASPQ